MMMIIVIVIMVCFHKLGVFVLYLIEGNNILKLCLPQHLGQLLMVLQLLMTLAVALASCCLTP